jgi:hypothetical protein
MFGGDLVEVEWELLPLLGWGWGPWFEGRYLRKKFLRRLRVGDWDSSRP